MPAKSLRLGPLAVPDDYFVDFAQGCIDGDGSIITYTDYYRTFKSHGCVYERLIVSLASGSKRYLEGMQFTRARLISLSGGILESHRGRFAGWSLRYLKHDSCSACSNGCTPLPMSRVSPASATKPCLS